MRRRFYCQCGCGSVVNFDRHKKPRKYIAGHNNKGKRPPNWKNGISHSHGRVFIFKPNHPFAYGRGYVPRYRLVMEKKLRRFLTSEEHVHHINGVKDDDRIENLQVMNNSDHLSVTHKGKKHRLGHKATEETKMKMRISQRKRFDKMKFSD